MDYIIRSLYFFLFLFLQITASATLHVGVAKSEITPPIGTPSAGYMDRKGVGMEGIHDPLLAIALFIDNGEKQIFLCSIDHLGLPYDIVKEIDIRVHKHPELSQSEIYIASSHSHSAGGAYLNIPGIGEALAGRYDPKIVEQLIQKTTETLIAAYNHRVAAKIGIGYGKAPSLNYYRALWPKNILPPSYVSVIKITTSEDAPLAALCNYAVHPTVLPSTNRLFSADFVGYTRTFLESSLGPEIQALYMNGAQGDINPKIFDSKDPFASCEILGKTLAQTVLDIWNETQAEDSLQIATEKLSYIFRTKPTPLGHASPMESYQTEMNIIVLNHKHAFLTIPGELSCLYDQSIEQTGKELGFLHVSVLGLCNDAHGYIITPDAWRHKTYESRLSFGGEEYGEVTYNRAKMLLQAHAPIRE